MRKLVVGVIIGVLLSAPLAVAATHFVLRPGDTVRIGATPTRCYVGRGTRTGRAAIVCGPLTRNFDFRPGKFYVSAGVDRVCLRKANGKKVACRWNR
jgi:hypothetical protein